MIATQIPLGDLLALRLTLRYGALPLHFPDAQLRSLQRRGLVDTHAHLTDAGRAAARSSEAQHIHPCTSCRVGPVETDCCTPRGEEVCTACRERERAAPHSQPLRRSRADAAQTVDAEG